ncbi:uncharacterized protein LOC143956835 [Lithobates pipiens]
MRCNNPRSSQEWTPPTITCTAQCFPPTIPNTAYIPEYKEYYNNGEEVRVWCNTGYYPSSFTMRCTNPDTYQEWTPPTITCTELCKNPEKTILEMSPEKIFYNIGDTVTVKCSVGYWTPHSSVRCVKSGSSIGWNNPPQCIAQCSPPTIPNMGSISVHKKYYNKNEVIRVRCRSGYYPSSSAMTCENPHASQEWTPPTITCIELCKNPEETILEMSPEKIFYNIGDTVTVKCSVGYWTPDSSVECVMSGSSIGWDYPPQCIALCAHPTIPNMVDISVYKKYYNKNEVIRVWCQSGYYPSSSTMRCDNPRSPPEWTPPTVTCIGVTMEDWRVTSSSISRRISCTPQCPDTWRFTVKFCAKPYNYESCKTSYDKSVTFTDLQPSSEYKIDTTLYIYWGQSPETLESIYIRTKDSVPGQPEITRVPSMEDNTIRWRLSEKRGNITGFQMNISAWRDYNVSFAVDESLQFPPNVTEYKIPLQYGTNYTITLQGFTSAGAGGVTTQNIENDIGDPPLHMEKTMDVDTLQLHPVLNLNGPIRSYDIIVFGGKEDNSTEECLNFENTPYNSSWSPIRYTAAVLPAETLTGPRTFTLGDNHHYNGFHNAPLIPNHNYTAYIRVTSRWKHVCLY